MKKCKLICAIILLNAGLVSLIAKGPAIDEYSLERLSRFIEEVSLAQEKADILIEHLQSINSRFFEYISVKNDFSDRVRNGENVWLGLNEEYQSNVILSWSIYSDHVESFAQNLEEIMSPAQINLFYNFLLDELWYEGFITTDNTLVKESLLESYNSERSADTTEFIREYGRDVFDKMLIEYDQDPDFPIKKDLVTEEPYREANIRGIEPIYAEDVDEQYNQRPPWKEMKRPEATTSSFLYFFEQQNLPALKYYHLTLFPQLAEILQHN